MGYIGNTPADKYQTLQKQSFTTSATTSYTLSYSVTNPQEIALFINNVRQNPNSSYTVSGTTLTLSSATTGTDVMYAVFLGKSVGTIAPALGSVTNDMLSGSIATSKLADGSTFGQTNTPAFFAYRTADQSISSDSQTKLEMNVEAYDTNSAYDNSTNYRFTVPSDEGGKYAISGYSKNSNLTASTKVLSIYKNGSAIMTAQDGNNTSYATLQASTIVDLDVGDYVELYGFQTVGSSQIFVTGGLNTSGFFGYKLIGV